MKNYKIEVRFLQVDFLKFACSEFLNSYEGRVESVRMDMSQATAVADREKIKSLHGFAELAKDILSQLDHQ